MPRSEHVKDVLVVIGLYEDSDAPCCDNQLIDLETGLDADTVDSVLDHLWSTDQIEAIMAPGDRHPSLERIRRVVAGRERLLGDEGRFQANQSA
jgi:hypothetical protein